MNSKKFSKINLRRIVTFITIYIILMLFVMTSGSIERDCEFTIRKGIPFRYFFSHGGACEKEGVIRLIEFKAQFSVMALVADMLFWGIVSFSLSLLIVWVYEKMKKKR